VRLSTTLAGVSWRYMFKSSCGVRIPSVPLTQALSDLQRYTYYDRQRQMMTTTFHNWNQEPIRDGCIHTQTKKSNDLLRMHPKNSHAGICISESWSYEPRKTYEDPVNWHWFLECSKTRNEHYLAVKINTTFERILQTMYVNLPGCYDAPCIIWL
jgi:hypothetical protein